jgi:hypothetical protein
MDLCISGIGILDFVSSVRIHLHSPVLSTRKVEFIQWRLTNLELAWSQLKPTSPSKCGERTQTRWVYFESNFLVNNVHILDRRNSSDSLATGDVEKTANIIAHLIYYLSNSTVVLKGNKLKCLFVIVNYFLTDNNCHLNSVNWNGHQLKN